MYRDDTKGQHERGYSSEQQHDTIDTMEGLAREHQSVEHIEHDDEYRHLEVV